MSYIVKEKFNIYDLVPAPEAKKTILVVEPEEYLSKLYGKYLVEHGFSVYFCPEVERVREHVSLRQPHVVILNPDIFGKLREAVKVLRQVAETNPKLLVVTVSYNTEPEHLKEYMSAGIASHINRKHSKPQDIVTLVKGLLQH